MNLNFDASFKLVINFLNFFLLRVYKSFDLDHPSILTIQSEKVENNDDLYFLTEKAQNTIYVILLEPTLPIVKWWPLEGFRFRN